jgi:precorrin-3B methylase
VEQTKHTRAVKQMQMQMQRCTAAVTDVSSGQYHDMMSSTAPKLTGMLGVETAAAPFKV